MSIFFATAYFQNPLPPLVLNLSQIPNHLEDSKPTLPRVANLFGNRELEYLGQTPKTTPTIPPTGTLLVDVPPAQSNLTDNRSARISEAFQRNLRNWSVRTQTTEPQILQILGNYPEKARSAGAANGEVYVVLKVDENGKIISDTLQVLGSSYSDGTFDDEALSAVRKHPFPATGKPQAYLVRVQFNNDSTGSGSWKEPPTPAETPSLPKP